MKKLSVLLVIAFALFTIALTSFRTENPKAMAQVNFVQGFYAFVECDPVAEFEMLGQEKITGGSTAGFEKVRDILMKRARKDYPDADGIIFSLPNNATVIKFK